MCRVAVCLCLVVLLLPVRIGRSPLWMEARIHRCSEVNQSIVDLPVPLPLSIPPAPAATFLVEKVFECSNAFELLQGLDGVGRTGRVSTFCSELVTRLLLWEHVVLDGASRNREIYSVSRSRRFLDPRVSRMRSKAIMTMLAILFLSRCSGDGWDLGINGLSSFRGFVATS